MSAGQITGHVHLYATPRPPTPASYPFSEHSYREILPRLTDKECRVLASDELE